jgi:salicylate hydroxylase
LAELPQGVMRRSPHVLIAGAGIGGLTAALCLARIGHRVTLLERSQTFEEIGAGLQISPNASAILRDLGLIEMLAADALAPSAIRVRRARDGATLALLPLDQAEMRWGAPYLLVHRADLQRALVAAVEREPNIKLAMQTSLAGLAATPEGVKVTALRGAIRMSHEGDCLIGADGLRSVVRERLSREPPLPRHAERIAYRALIDAARAPAALRAPESALWLGPKAHVVHYPLRGGRAINVVAVADVRTAIDWTAEFWSQSAETREMAEVFAGFDRRLRDLLDAGEWRRWPLVERPSLATWTNGPIALLGDAAHPMLPFLAQGAAQAIEDAAALARALACSATIAHGLGAYQAARFERARRVQAASRRQAVIYHLAGPASVARDLAMRLMGPQYLLAQYDWLYRVET